MKKKGLIVATIVMVLVLAVSLTTATYAWFSNTASTSVDTIAVNIAALSDIDIGVTSSSNYGSDESSNYYYESVSLTPSGNAYTITDGALTLGSTLTLPEFTMSSAVGTANAANLAALQALSASAIDDDFNPSHLVFAASTEETDGTKVGDPKMSEATVAIANSEYINLAMGARTNKNNTYGIVCKVQVTTTDAAASDTLKMNAALHFYIETGASNGSAVSYKDIDVFSGSYTQSSTTYNMGRTTQKSQVANYTNSLGVTYEVNSSNEAVATFYFVVGGATNTSGSALSSSTIYPFHIYGFIWGEDSDCVTNATGCKCNIDISFIPVNATTIGSSGELYGVSYVALSSY